jgi:RecA/RadA recombinase
MTIKFLGPNVPVTRIETGFWSFDNACMNTRGERGFAIPAYSEVYAAPGVGKTAFVTSLGGVIADRLTKNVVFLDWELQDFDTIMHILENQNFDGTLQRILEEEDEESMDKFYKVMKNEEYGVGILDSIAALSPVSEQKGKQTDANMGRRAMNMSKFSRKSIRNLQLRNSPAAVFATNHIHPTIGAMFAGTDTAGGETKKFLTTYRILLKKFFYVKAKHENFTSTATKFDDGWILQGRIEKSRMGFAMKNFHVVMIMGEGLHKGLSALWDCLIYKYADLNRTVKMDDVEYGTMKSFIDNRDKDELFEPFINKLKSIVKVVTPDEEDEYELVQVEDE